MFLVGLVGQLAVECGEIDLECIGRLGLVASRGHENVLDVLLLLLLEKTLERGVSRDIVNGVPTGLFCGGGVLNDLRRKQIRRNITL